MIKINRWYSSDKTLGELTLEGTDFKCFTLELPWMDNKRDISCIYPYNSVGLTYRARKIISPKNGHCIELVCVASRTDIQIHAGNWLRDILGCILVGDSIRHHSKGIMVTNSRRTLKKLLSLLPEEFNIEIT